MLSCFVVCPQIVSIEADFLKSLHQVRKMASELDRLTVGLAKSSTAAGAAAAGGALGAAAHAAYAPVGKEVAALKQRATTLQSDYDRANKVRVASLVWPSSHGRTAWQCQHESQRLGYRSRQSIMEHSTIHG